MHDVDQALRNQGYETFTYRPRIWFRSLSANTRAPTRWGVYLVDGDIGACVITADDVTIARRSGQDAPWVSEKPGTACAPTLPTRSSS
jgi:hypothetical protein